MLKLQNGSPFIGPDPRRRVQKDLLGGAEDYLRIVRGTLKNWLLKDSVLNKVKVVSKSQLGAKEAILDYQLIGEHEGLSLVRINLLAGAIKSGSSFPLSVILYMVIRNMERIVISRVNKSLCGQFRFIVCILPRMKY